MVKSLSLKKKKMLAFWPKKLDFKGSVLEVSPSSLLAHNTLPIT